jgi:hypothetical protein
MLAQTAPSVLPRGGISLHHYYRDYRVDYLLDGRLAECRWQTAVCSAWFSRNSVHALRGRIAGGMDFATGIGRYQHRPTDFGLVLHFRTDPLGRRRGES